MSSRFQWLNRTVVGTGVTSGLGDLCYETAQAVLPAFLTLLGTPAALIGSIEGLADGLNSFTKLAVGYLGDRLGARKTLAVVGYALTPLGGVFIALATAWPMVLIGRLISWFGKGVRGPVRDAILAGSVDPAFHGRAFGLHRAADTLGAVLGPGLAWLILAGIFALPTLGEQSPAHAPPDHPLQVAVARSPTPMPSGIAEASAADAESADRMREHETTERRLRRVLWLAVIPGVLSVLSFALLVEDRGQPAKRKYEFAAAWGRLPRRFRRYLGAVGLFALGDFSPAMLILAATSAMGSDIGLSGAAAYAAGLYLIRNSVQTVVSWPAGDWGDRWGIGRTLIVGYFLGASTGLGAALVFMFDWSNLAVLIGLFSLSGAYAAFQEALEPAAAAGMLPEVVRGLGFGALGAVNGFGKLVSSALVGWLWTLVSPTAAFTTAAFLMGAGTIALTWAFSSPDQDCNVPSEY